MNSSSSAPNPPSNGETSGESDTTASRERTAGASRRFIGELEPGYSTAVPSNVAYRLGKLKRLGILRGDWLDCGCADGGYTIPLTEMGASKAVGVDPDPERIEAGRKRTANHSSTRFLQASAEDLPFSEGAFDGVLMNEVLEHVRDERRALSEAHRVLRPGGYLALMSPNRWFPFEGHGIILGRLKTGYPVPFIPWLPSSFTRGLVRARNYWPHELEQLVLEQGFSIKTTEIVLPVFEVYPWLPATIIRRYRQLVPQIEKVPILGRMGVSALVVGQRKAARDNASGSNRSSPTQG